MSEELYSVDQIADQLRLHVRTVRSYIRTGRLKAVKIGKQYRISHADLIELTGGSAPPPTRSTGPAPMEVSSIVQIEGVGRAAADRVQTLILAQSGITRDLRVQTVNDEERSRMKIVILGGAAATADLLHLLNSLVEGDNNLISRELGDA